MRTFYTVIAAMLFMTLYGQTRHYDEYFLGEKFICDNNDPEINKLMKLGIDCFQYPDYYGAATNVFLKVIEKDSSNCDAYFFAGYSLRLQNKPKEALAFYYVADSLSGNKSQVFKQNLAVTAFMLGADKVARKKYVEMTRFFPESAEGFYGIALTSLSIKDFESGLQCIDIALEKYNQENEEALYLKSILLVIRGKYDDAIPLLQKVKKTFKKDDNFNAAYALCLHVSGEESNDNKKRAESKKYLDRIKDRQRIFPELLEKLTF